MAGTGGCAGPRPGTSTVERTVAAMGTWLDMQVTADDRATALRASEAAVAAVEACEARLSTWRPTSELSRLNAARVDVPVRLSPPTVAELHRALHWQRETAGAFDPTCGALLAAYGVRDGGRWPSPPERAAALAASGAALLALADADAARSHPGLRVDAGAFGKGAALDAAAAALRAAGARAAELDFGGQWLLLAPGAVDLAHPRERGRIVATWRVEAGSVATSGNGERATRPDGRALGHLLDPRTGTPAADFGSVAVWCERALDADCLATGLFVLGPAAAVRFADAHDGVECVVLELDGADGAVRLRASRGAGAMLDHVHATL
ncbi:MAG: FAD:protein FMN transferase [Planctomycetota bacterium]